MVNRISAREIVTTKEGILKQNTKFLNNIMPKLLIYDINHTFSSKSLLSNWCFLLNIYRKVKINFIFGNIKLLSMSAIIIKQNVHMVMLVKVGHFSAFERIKKQWCSILHSKE